MDTDDIAAMSLRERKKSAAREALSCAALRLATERGLDSVRVEEIAAEVGVSARTFNNYFSSKEEAICAISVDRHARIRDTLRACPAEQPLWEAVIHAVLEQYSSHGEPDRAYVARVRLMVSNSALRGEYLKSHANVERVLAEAIAERTGTDVERDLYPRLMAGVVCGAVRVAIEHWLDSDSAASFVPTLRQTLEWVAAGLPAATVPSGRVDD